MSGLSIRPKYTNPKRQRGPRWRFGLVYSRQVSFSSHARRCLFGVLASLLIAGCGNSSPPARARKLPEVIVTTPTTGEVVDYQDFTGRLSAWKTVDIRARVSGYVISAPFKEGDVIGTSVPLFQIDPRPYKAQLDAAKAQVASARAQIAQGEANLKLAQVTYERAKSSGSAATPLELDQDLAQARVSQANLNFAKANLGTAEANLDTAQLNFDWTTVRAPLGGRISRRLVDPGNLVMADTTLLTTIVTEDPLYAYFDVDERTYLDLLGITASGQSAWFLGLQFPVLLRLANEDDFSHVGTVDFVDNQIASTTGTIRMRGVFTLEHFTQEKMQEHGDDMKVTADKVKAAPFRLKPGLFVRIRLPIGNPYQAVLVLDEAILSDQGRKYLFVLNEKDEVVYRPVQLGQALGVLRVIKKGLNGGERVIVTGTQRVRQGVKVQPKAQPAPQPPHSSLAKLLKNFHPLTHPAAAQEKESRKQPDNGVQAGSGGKAERPRHGKTE